HKRRWLPWGPGGRQELRRTRPSVEQELRDLDGRDPVNQGMVGSTHDRKSAVAEAVDDVQLPQGTAAIQRLRKQLPDEGLEFYLLARLRERAPGDVVGDVELTIVDPHRVVEDGGHRAPAKARQQLE